MRSVFIQKDKEIFKVDEMPAEEYAASMGLPGAPQIKFSGGAGKVKARGGVKSRGGVKNGDVDEEQEEEEEVPRGVVGSDEDSGVDEEDEEDEISGENVISEEDDEGAREVARSTDKDEDEDERSDEDESEAESSETGLKNVRDNHSVLPHYVLTLFTVYIRPCTNQI